MKLLVAGLVLIGLPTAAADSSLAGKYRTVAVGVDACSLEIASLGTFVQRCRGRQITGRMERFGGAIALYTNMPNLLEPDGAADASALATYMQWHLKEHGYYPVAVPGTTRQNPDHLGCVMIPVRLMDSIYLVETFQRDAFCVAAKASVRMSTSAPPHRVFVRPAGKNERTDITWQQFCALEWKLRPE